MRGFVIFASIIFLANIPVATASHVCLPPEVDDTVCAPDAPDPATVVAEVEAIAAEAQAIAADAVADAEAIAADAQARAQRAADNAQAAAMNFATNAAAFAEYTATSAADRGVAEADELLDAVEALDVGKEISEVGAGIQTTCERHTVPLSLAPLDGTAYETAALAGSVHPRLQSDADDAWYAIRKPSEYCTKSVAPVVISLLP